MASTTSSSSAPSSASIPRQRIRDLFPPIVIGRYPTGVKNSLTDVPGVLVHTESIRKPNAPGQHAQNTGVTTILPRKDWFNFGCHAGLFRWNGSGEMTGAHWIEETGQLSSPVIITSSFSVGACYDGVYQWALREHKNEDGLADWFLLPVIAETFDGYCHDIGSMAIKPEMVVRGIDQASNDPVPEGCTGGGTGMMCQGFKAGTGSSSRLLKGSIKNADGSVEDKTFTLGALVQTNFGAQWDLHIGRVPIGKLLMDPEKRKKWEENLAKNDTTQTSLVDDEPKGPKGPNKDGSIIIVLATDAPLHPLQLQRLAKRATVGLTRTGGWGSNTSGDIFLAFSTAEKIPRDAGLNWKLDVNADGAYSALNNQSINALFEAAADAVEESIYNALCMAEDTEGPMGRVAKALPLDRVRELLEKYYVA